MTPDDVARYRAFAAPGSNEWVLLDALESEIAKRRRAFAEMLEDRERAERAESRAELAEGRAMDHYAKRVKAEAALARVRALCDDVNESRSTHPFASTVEIRAAIDGS